MKRFYKNVEVSSTDEGFLITLDKKALLSPGKSILVVPTKALADAIADEWGNQEINIIPSTMPLMTLTATAIDRVRPRPDDTIDEILNFLQTDLLCYRAEEPEALVLEQDQLWNPLLDWCEGLIGSAFNVTSGIMPVMQAPKLISSAQKILKSYNEFELLGLHQFTSIAGSAVIGLSLLEHQIELEAAWQAAFVDDYFQINNWGEDAEASLRIANRRREMLEIKEFLDLVLSRK